MQPAHQMDTTAKKRQTCERLIIPTIRADSVLTRLDSCAVAVQVARARREAAQAVE
jgi:hypothetical protein